MSESYSRTKRRYWRRADDPRPWWPWGILPFVGLIIAYLIGALLMAPRIEAEVRSEVAERLDGSTFESVVRSDGQGVSILATTMESDRNHVDALARSTRCNTWAGELTCPTSVQIEIDQPEIVPAAAPTVAQVVVTDAVDTSETMDVAAAGAVASIDAAELETDRCNDEFAAILGEASIQFRTSSAEIDASSDELLLRIATVAETCPGTLHVEGHTDSRGDEEMNRILSEARANAVRNALGGFGIDVNRVSAEGYGATSPIADNNTSTGRAQNRRIVISVE